MGHDHKTLAKLIIDRLGKYGLTEVSIYLFGSHAMGLAHASSDIDVLIISDEKIDPKIKLDIREALKAINVSGFVFSEKSIQTDLNHSSIEAACLEKAVRYGKKIYGKGSVCSQMTDDALLGSMLMVALYVNRYWESMSNRDYVCKEFVRSTVLLWCLENKLGIEVTYSLGHFIVYNLENGGDYKDDKLWELVSLSGQLWLWLDLDFQQTLENKQFRAWSKMLEERFLPHLWRLSRLEFGPISEEGYDLIKEHGLTRSIVWARTSDRKFFMPDSGVGMVLRLLKN